MSFISSRELGQAKVGGREQQKAVQPPDQWYGSISNEGQAVVMLSAKAYAGATLSDKAS
jgi:hypothetical protein